MCQYYDTGELFTFFGQMDVQKVFYADDIFEAQSKALRFAESVELADGDFYIELIGSYYELPVLPVHHNYQGGFYCPFEDRFENPDNIAGAGYEDIPSERK